MVGSPMADQGCRVVVYIVHESWLVVVLSWLSWMPAQTVTIIVTNTLIIIIYSAPACLPACLPAWLSKLVVSYRFSDFQYLAKKIRPDQPLFLALKCRGHWCKNKQLDTRRKTAETSRTIRHTALYR